METPVFIQDYHLALVAARLRERRPTVRSALFWHIPWPYPDRLRNCGTRSSSILTTSTISPPALTRALDMPIAERRARMQAMRRVVAGRNVFGWASDILEGLESLWTKPLQYAARAPEDAPV